MKYNRVHLEAIGYELAPVVVDTSPRTFEVLNVAGPGKTFTLDELGRPIRITGSDGRAVTASRKTACKTFWQADASRMTLRWCRYEH